MENKTWVELRNEAHAYVESLVAQYVPSDSGNSALLQAIGNYGYYAMRQGEYQESQRIANILRTFPKTGKGPTITSTKVRDD